MGRGTGIGSIALALTALPWSASYAQMSTGGSALVSNESVLQQWAQLSGTPQPKLISTTDGGTKIELTAGVSRPPSTLVRSISFD
jgi:hypothetical protein